VREETLGDHMHLSDAKQLVQRKTLVRRDVKLHHLLGILGFRNEPCAFEQQRSRERIQYSIVFVVLQLLFFKSVNQDALETEVIEVLVLFGHLNQVLAEDRDFT